MTGYARLVIFALGLMLAAPLAGEARADSGSIWTLAQDGRPLNRVATWERANGRARIFILGSTLFLDVNMTQPVSTAGGVNIFGYVATDTRAQPANSGVWEVVARGEVALDTRTMRDNGMDGWWRRTERIARSVDSNQIIRDTSPQQRIRFVVD
jgi:hypothetical protein